MKFNYPSNMMHWALRPRLVEAAWNQIPMILTLTILLAFGNHLGFVSMSDAISTSYETTGLFFLQYL